MASDFLSAWTQLGLVYLTVPFSQALAPAPVLGPKGSQAYINATSQRFFQE
jgi:hypothetical protein